MSDHKFNQETVEAGVAGLIVKEAVRILLENKLHSKSQTLNNLLKDGSALAATLVWNSYGKSIKQHTKNAINKSQEQRAQPHSVFSDHVNETGAALANEVWADHHQN